MIDRRRLLQASAGMGLLLTGSSGRTARALAQDGFHLGKIVHRGMPLNAEPRPDVLRASFFTKQSDFYIRNHGTIPKLDEGSHKLTVTIPGQPPVIFTMDDLRSKFPQRSVTAVMQCAGNRRSDMIGVKYVSGDAWQTGAISNAEWTGIALADVFKSLGVKEEGDSHVAFAALDDIEEKGERFKFGVSIPLAKAMEAETLLAFSLNGEPLSAEHGFPIRAVVPGYAGVRSPKWLASITVQDKPSDDHIQQKEYKLFPPDVTEQAADLSKGTYINEMPLTSAICQPMMGDRLTAGQNVIRGYAIGASSPVTRVEVSTDGGRSWKDAVLEPQQTSSRWSWTFWNFTADLPAGNVNLMVRASDASHKAQPETMAEVWNFPGYLATAWHRVHVTAS